MPRIRTRREPRAALGLAVLLPPALLASPAGADETPEIVVRAPWGAGDGELGRSGGDESAPVGPMSFAVGPAGEVLVLDQVNRRVARFDARGRWLGAVPVGLDTFQDLALAPGGQLVLLDRLAAQVVRVLDPDGARLAETQLLGAGIEEGGGTTALFARDDGVWVEYDHQRSVRVLDARFREPFFRAERTGRPLPDGRQGHARLAGRSAVEVWTVDPGREAVAARAELRYGGTVRRIAALAGDAQGRVVVAVHLWEEDPETFAARDERLELRVLDAALVERRRFETSPSVGAWEQFKEFEVTPEGTIWQLAFVEAGVEVRRWRQPPPASPVSNSADGSPIGGRQRVPRQM